ncbi:hypothetical protein WA158_000955 [Blastocystis sp. Blastoise]
MFSRVVPRLLKNVRFSSNLTSVKEATKNLPSNVRVATKKAVKEVEKFEELKKPKSKMSQRVLAAFLGIVSATAVGVYYFNQTLQQSTDDLEHDIEILRNDIADNVNSIDRQITECEKAALKN